MRSLTAAMGAAVLGRMLEFPAMGKIYDGAAGSANAVEFIDRVFDLLGVSYHVPADKLANVPTTGPLIVVANHPFGALEGLVLPRALLTVRPDVRVMANFMLSRIPELRELMIFVDPFGKPESARANLAGMRESLAHLRQGGVLIVFPAGTVSHLHVRRRCITDPPWSPIVARLIRRAQAPVLPVYFEGRNGTLFQLAGLVHPRLRTLMLPHELMKRQHTTISMRMGRPVPAARLAQIELDDDLIAYLRLRTYVLAGATAPRRSLHDWLSRGALRHPRQETIVAAQDPQALAAEIAALPPSSLMHDAGEMAVYIAPAPQIPAVLQELGRLRETTFRQVGEGTGRATDLDRFDAHYLHLFIWHRDRHELVGAYRVGQTDLLLPRFGLAGLYTHSLFRFKPQLIAQIAPALELGRSFVRGEYQKSFAPLMLLWKGLGRFVVAHPRYRYLFGPVSINDRYKDLSQWMMLAFLKTHRYLPHLASLVRPKHPPLLRPPRDWDLAANSRVVTDIDDVSSLIADIEDQQTGVPILVKQYLRVGAQMLAFNVDPGFGHTLDGLVLVDLTQTDRTVLKHYFTRQGRDAFLAHHGVSA
ncbi:MAG: GNAT family N-acyltransferase [Phycisphaeraceae bacterium]